MRGFVQALKAALRAMRQWVWRIVDGALTLVQTDPLSAGSAPSGDDQAEVVQDDAPAPEERWAHIRHLALNLDRAGGEEVVLAGGTHVFEWLDAMPLEMRCRVACASDEALREHMAGRQSIRGVLLYQAPAIAEYVRATRGVPQPEEPSSDPDRAFAV